jgi:hypothetical protein
MSPAVEWPGMSPAQLAAIAKDDLRAAHFISRSRSVEPRMYLYRRGRLEIEPLPTAAFEDAVRTGFALRGFLPLLIAAGSVEILALGFAPNATSVERRQMIALHMFDRTGHRAWEAPILQSAPGGPSIGHWRPAATNSLDQRTIRAITTAVNS